MERLTGRNEKGELLFDGELVYAGDFYEAVSALEEYEDTGLTPEQVRELQERQDKIVEQLEDAQDEYYRKYHDEHVDIMYNEGKSDGMQVAINIVKGGAE